MEFQIANDHLTVRIDSLGAELMSIRYKGREMLWQGDAAFWKSRSPILFPYIARLKDGMYHYEGKTYRMNIHGFARSAEFKVLLSEKERIVFQLCSSGDTLAQYPFRFELEVAYSLCENRLQVDYRVKNTGLSDMYFGLGGHPGFALPLEDGLEFSDYTLEFNEECSPSRILFSENLLVDGEAAFPLEGKRRLPLHHGLFDDDAIILRGTTGIVTLQSNRGHLALRFEAPDFPYMGFWHAPKTQAPYLCIEPWSSLPAQDKAVTELETQADLLCLSASAERHLGWTVSFQEKE